MHAYIHTYIHTGRQPYSHTGPTDRTYIHRNIHIHGAERHTGTKKTECQAGCVAHIRTS